MATNIKNGSSDLTWNKKLDLFLIDMDKRGVGRLTAAPPVYRFLWKVGIKIPPPLFASLLWNAIFMSTYFFLMSEVVIRILFYGSSAGPVYIPVLLGLLAGNLTAIITSVQKRRLRLPKWPRYLEQNLDASSDTFRSS
jgi:hypothetical protein